MQFGVNFIFDSTMVELGQLSRETEQFGFDRIWVVDAPLTPASFGGDWKIVTDPLVQMGAILVSTETISVGQSVLLVTLRDPIVTAKAIAYAQHASQGRVVIGAGMGWRDDEYNYFQVDKRTRGRRMDAALDAMDAFFRGDATFTNEFYGWYDATPLPVLGETPFTWIGGNSRAAMERALTRGAGWMPLALWMDDFPELATEYVARGGARLGVKIRVARTQEEVEGGVGGLEKVRDTILGFHELGVQEAGLVFGRNVTAHRTHQEWFATELMPELVAATASVPVA